MMVKFKSYDLDNGKELIVSYENKKEICIHEHESNYSIYLSKDDVIKLIEGLKEISKGMEY